LAYTQLTGKHGPHTVPAGEYNVLQDLMRSWEMISGYQVEPTTKQLLAMANAKVQTLSDFAKFMSTQKNAQGAIKKMPWAGIGLSKDEYVATSKTFETTYKELTGKDISAEALAKAFDAKGSGGVLTGSEYKQQLMNDAALQNAFGWVKYGYDFAAWTQQKLSLHSAYGRSVDDAEAATILQYTKSASGPNMTAIARGGAQQAQQQPSGVGQSVVR
jgi:hypothetical protein